MIGIKFKIENKYDKFLFKILNNIDNENNKWEVNYDEVFKRNSEFLFDKNIYSNTDFMNIIRKEEYYIVFIKLKLYNVNDKIDVLNNLDNFKNSPCKLYLKIIDSEFVEIYTKDREILNLVKSNATNYNFKNIEEISK